MFFPTGVVARGRAAIVHEVTHVFAPNANRLLAEGLAVHAQETLGNRPAYPNFGADLHNLARPLAPGAELASLDRIATPAPLRDRSARLNDREAYRIAGSFVRFLIESFGLPRFRELYALTPLRPGTRDAGPPGRWSETLGRTLDALADAWRDRLNR